MFAKGEFFFRPQDTESQAEFLSFPKGKNDDVMDAVWTALEGARPCRDKTFEEESRDNSIKNKFLDWMTL